MKSNWIALAVCSLLLSGIIVESVEAKEFLPRGSVSKQVFGKTANGKAVDIYTLTNTKGTIVKIMTYGATVTEIHTHDKNGKLGDIVLGFNKLQPYLDGHPFFGCIAGRVANRIANGKFTLDEKNYTLAKNNGPNTLHGGKIGFDKVLWKSERANNSADPAVRFTYLSKNGEEGFPGNLNVAITYTLTNQDNALKIDYIATTDQATLVNLTNHTYFNLKGEGDVLDHRVYLNASHYTPVDETVIPTGEIKSVKGTPFDFTTPELIGKRIADIPGEPGGYDHNFALDTKGDVTKLAGWASEYSTGRKVELFTTTPGTQLYTGNFLDGSLTGKNEFVYQKQAGFCFEAQGFPDAIHKKNFPSIVLRPGPTYRQTTIYRFSAK